MSPKCLSNMSKQNLILLVKFQSFKNWPSSDYINLCISRILYLSLVLLSWHKKVFMKVLNRNVYVLYIICLLKFNSAITPTFCSPFLFSPQVLVTFPSLSLTCHPFKSWFVDPIAPWHGLAINAIWHPLTFSCFRRS